MPAPDTRYDVFLSHNSADKPAVQALADQLRAAGLAPFLDTWHLIPGTPWQEGIEQALEDSNSVAVFVGPSGISPWHNEEMRDALDRAVRSRDDYRVIPVLLPGADEGSVSRFLARRVWVDFRTGLDDEAALQRLVAGITGEAIEVGSYELPDEPAPYRGLLPFEAEHARFFFGRDDDIQRLVDKLAQRAFTAVVGASGSGKSSLVKAGLLPRLAENALPHSAHWHVLALTPGSQPLRALASQLATLAPAAADRLQTADALVERLQARRDGLHTALAAYLADQPGPVLLFVDQFEELFTQCPEGPERCRAQSEQFVANLADAVQQGNGQIRVLITLRADFIDRCLALSDLRGLLEDRQLLLGPLDEPALRDAIVRPAQAVGALFEKGLVELILRDVGTEPGMLPLLQQELYELWLRRRGPWLTVEAYEVSGGVLGALQKRADDTYGALTFKQQEIARGVFLRLTTLGEGAVDTRRRVQKEELYPVNRDCSEVDAVLDVLSGPQVRLLIIDEATVEVAHEALIQRWNLLGRWLEENRQSLRVQRRLTEAASQWQQNEMDESYLYRGGRLLEAEECASENSDRINQVEQSFLTASLALREREESKRRAEQRARQRRARVLTALATAVLILLIPALFVGANAWMFNRRQDSNWQLTGFPNESVLTIAVANNTDDPQVPRLCIGSADIGIGCSNDLQNWNIYQVGFPTTVAAQFNDRDALLSNLTGSTWSTKIQGVEGLAFDVADPRRIVAAFAQGSGLFMSEDGGAHWHNLPSVSTAAGTPKEVRQIAIAGEHLLLLEKVDQLAAAPDLGGSLYLSRNDGASWQRIGGPGTATGAILGFAPALDSHGKLDGVYAAGEGGLQWSTMDGRWERLLPGDRGDLGTTVTAAGDTIYLGTYNKETELGTIYRWSREDPGLSGRWIQFEEAPRSLTVTGFESAETLVWVLFDSGEVVTIDGAGQLTSRGQRPGWPWSFAKTLSTLSTAAGEIVLMGHRDGLLQYCRQVGQAGECTSLPVTQ